MLNILICQTAGEVKKASQASKYFSAIPICDKKTKNKNLPENQKTIEKKVKSLNVTM